MTADLAYAVGILAGLIVLVGAIAVGWSTILVRRAADRAVAKLADDETRSVRHTATRLPPTVALRDAIALSLRDGMTIEEAAQQLYRERVRRLIEEHLR